MFSIFRDTDQLSTVESQVHEMLDACARMFDLATDAVFGIQVPEAVQDELWALDKTLNKDERSIRRELLIHGTVRGAEVDQGLMLIYMSISKDIERIGDYCKNIWDIAANGITVGGEEDTAQIKGDVDEVARVLEKGSEIFKSDDTAAVHEFIPEIDGIATRFDGIVDGYARTDQPGYFAVPRALLYRHLKRICGHMSNVLTSQVMPVDRLDFYKKSKAINDPD